MRVIPPGEVLTAMQVLVLLGCQQDSGVLPGEDRDGGRESCQDVVEAPGVPDGAVLPPVAAGAELAVEPTGGLLFYHPGEGFVATPQRATVGIRSVGSNDLLVSGVWVEEADRCPELRVGRRATAPPEPPPSEPACFPPEPPLSDDLCGPAEESAPCPSGGTFHLPPRAECTVQVLYEPVDGLPDAGRLVLWTNDEAKRDWRIPIGSVDAAPRLCLLPSEIAFHNVEVGWKVAEAFIVQNTGVLDLSIDIELERVPTDRFWITPDSVDRRAVDGDPAAGRLLRPGSYVLFHVWFRPAEPGVFSGRLVVRSNDPRRPVATMGVRAESVVSCIRTRPTAVEFGAVVVGGRSARPVAVENCGSRVVRVGSMVTAEAPGPFRVVRPLAGLECAYGNGLRQVCEGEASVGAGEEQSFVVEFAPQTEGGATASTVLHSNVRENENVTLELSGVGVGAW